VSAAIVLLVVLGAAIVVLAVVAVLATTRGRRPADRRAAREWEAFQASMRHPSRAGSRRSS
jgi:hypothetical protein